MNGLVTNVAGQVVRHVCGDDDIDVVSKLAAGCGRDYSIEYISDTKEPVVCPDCSERIEAPK